MTTAQLKAEMSIAGDPDKLMGIFSEILAAMGKVDATNPAELINLDLVIQRLHAECKLWIRMYERRTGQKIS